MDSFINEDFLLTTHISRQLYHEIAESLPVIDFHNHLDPRKLAENHKFVDLAELWIYADPYKHRVMRIAGIDEEMITGVAYPVKNGMIRGPPYSHVPLVILCSIGHVWS